MLGGLAWPDAAVQPVSEKSRTSSRASPGWWSASREAASPWRIVAAFEEGIRLARAGATKLEEAERKVEVLLEGDRTAPFSTQEK